MEQRPWRREMRCDFEGSVRLHEDAFPGDDEQGAWCFRILPGRGAELTAARRLDGEESKVRRGIASDDEPHRGAAQVTDAIKHDDGFCGRRGRGGFQSNILPGFRRP